MKFLSVLFAVFANFVVIGCAEETVNEVPSDQQREAGESNRSSASKSLANGVSTGTTTIDLAKEKQEKSQPQQVATNVPSGWVPVKGTVVGPNGQPLANIRIGFNKRFQARAEACTTGFDGSYTCYAPVGETEITVFRPKARTADGRRLLPDIFHKQIADIPADNRVFDIQTEKGLADFPSN